jgi:hypothetical protein
MSDNQPLQPHESPIPPLEARQGKAVNKWWERLQDIVWRSDRLGGNTTRVIGGGALALFLFFFILAWYWSWEPDLFEVKAVAQARAGEGKPLVSGYVTTTTLIEVASALLDKPGGYLSNDMTPPGLFMDNMPNWEFGVLLQVRDFSKAMRNDLSRSQTQSTEDKDLMEAEPKFNFTNNSWLLPPSEGQYRDGIKYVENYLKRLSDNNPSDGQFFARADNLRDWLKTVEKRLGSLSQRLSASVGQTRINLDSSDEAKARGQEIETKTSWLEIDDVFYETRGTAWALIHLLRAVEVDFKDVLVNKSALVSLQQIIRELEATQSTIWSPMIMNGSEFGLFANHSLVMSSYISRANAAIIDLRNLLSQG